MRKLNKKEEQRKASTENILACALDLFVKNGYRATTIDMIAAKAGLTKGAIYFYFKTKDAIMLMLLGEAEKYIVDPIEEYMANEGPHADAKLVKFINTQALLGVTKPQHVLLLILVSIDFSGTGDDIEKRAKAIYRRMYGHIEQLIAQGQTEGVFRSDSGSDELASIVMAAHDGVLIEWYRRPNELTGKTLTKALRSVLLNGLIMESKKNLTIEAARKKAL